MTMVTARDLRNHTAEALRRVSAGERVTVTSHGAPVAEIVPATPGKRAFLTRVELGRLLPSAQADPALGKELDELGGTTDDLGPIE